MVDKLDKTVKFRLSKTQLSKLKEMAILFSLSISSFIRHKLFTEVREQIEHIVPLPKTESMLSKPIIEGIPKKLIGVPKRLSGIPKTELKTAFSGVISEYKELIKLGKIKRID